MDVILVNEKDEAVGTAEKMEAHIQGLLHRAFSVFIFDTEGRMLLQQRAAGKYHGAHLWTNACCSHPYPGEEVGAAAGRRLGEELGFTVPVEKIFVFTYKTSVENNLIEHEYDHVFAGIYEGEINANPAEVEGYRYANMDAIRQEMEQAPEHFTTWFRIAFDRVNDWWTINFRNLPQRH